MLDLNLILNFLKLSSSKIKIICTKIQLDLEKSEEPEIKLPTSVGSQTKQKRSRKISTYDLLTMPKPFTVWITTNCGKFFRRWEYWTTFPTS